MKALLSVYDKSGIGDFARVLHNAGFEIVSTGGTSAAISQAGVPVREVSDLTGSPEILDGRVKTLHPVVHGGILALRDQPSHVAELERQNIGTIDVVVGNLYPFVKTVSDPGVAIQDALENIDIGGPTMLRAAAKNFPSVVVLVDPADYGWAGEKLSSGDLSALGSEERKALARKAFQHVALYDTAISHYLGEGDTFSLDGITLGFNKMYDMRYGENPHQKSALYSDVLSSGGIVHAEQLSGPEISHNNILDADAAWRAIIDFDEPGAVVVKHTNPCGLALHRDQPSAYRHAFEGDSVSAYGGIVGFNRTVTAETARATRGVFYNIVVAPDYEQEALEIFSRRRSLRVLKAEPESGPMAGVDVRRVSGGALLQTVDAIDEPPSSWEVKTKRPPTENELRDLAFAWKAAKHIKSNTIVLARDSVLTGMGAGQPNRVTSVHLAVRIAGEKSRGSVLASDAFMPFADNVELAAEGGIAAIVQPGGSMRDEEVIEAADKYGMAMVFTDTRHFKH